MNKNGYTLVIAFALFSLFFGAGNLILPPFLGLKAGNHWILVAFGFCISAVFLPLLGILAHAKLQGTMLDFGKKVSPAFSVVYCLFVYGISVTLPAPRTASVTHEMAIQPFFGLSSWTTSLCYFILVFIFVVNRSKILDLIGKLLTPLIICIIIAIISISLFNIPTALAPSEFETPWVSGLLEGYQTFDTIGAVVIGGVLIISIRLKGYTDYKTRKQLISRAGILAGIGLFIVYTGLIATGAIHLHPSETEVTRTQLLTDISLTTLGNTGRLFLSVLVAIACFTTAVGIITGTADFFKGLFNQAKWVYVLTAAISCVLGVLMGQLDVHAIIAVAVPALMLIYPITIIMILLNILPERYTQPIVFRWVVYTTIVFSLPDFITAMGYENIMTGIQNNIPLGNYSLGWLLPAALVFFIIHLSQKKLS